jgi:hypothetical protein
MWKHLVIEADVSFPSTRQQRPWGPVIFVTSYVLTEGVLALTYARGRVIPQFVLKLKIRKKCGYHLGDQMTSPGNGLGLSLLESAAHCCSLQGWS